MQRSVLLIGALFKALSSTYRLGLEVAHIVQTHRVLTNFPKWVWSTSVLNATLRGTHFGRREALVLGGLS